MKDTNAKVFHMLNRMAFGPRWSEVADLSQTGEVGIQAWIDKQLHPESISENIENQLSGLTALTMSLPQLHAAFPKPKVLKEELMSMEDSKSPELESFRDQMNGKRPRRMLNELYAQKLIRAVASEKQLQEVLVDFWFNHFNVDFTKGNIKWSLIPYERDVIRPNLFGTFRNLLGAVAKSPAMLVYLDNAQSVRDGFVPRGKNLTKKTPRGLNENYARELMELHTVGVDGGYSQTDVREVARALTGWSLQNRETFFFRPFAHDENAKQIMTLNLPAGGGISDGEKVLDYLSTHPKTAHFIAHKLAVKFISDEPPESAVQKLATQFSASKGNLRSIYSTLFSLPEFWNESARRKKIKMPFEYVASSLRALGAQVQLPAPHLHFRTAALLKEMGEPPYECQPPTGYKASSDFWVNPGALVTRINFGLALGAGRIPEVLFDKSRIQEKLEQRSAHAPEDVLIELNNWILQGEMLASTRSRLLAELNNDHEVYSDPKPNHVAPRHAINLQKLLGLIIGSPEFQRR